MFKAGWNFNVGNRDLIGRYLKLVAVPDIEIGSVDSGVAIEIALAPSRRVGEPAAIPDIEITCVDSDSGKNRVDN